VAKVKHEGPVDVKAIVARNEARRQKMADDLEAQRVEMALEFDEMRKRSGAVHRSPGLRMSRDRMRARGKRV
jgi:D-alanyl-D-alanine dipeptidase